MYPPAPAESTSSDAERRVFDLLANTAMEDTFALHSLTLTRHEYKAVAEADFVVVSPRGILVLEIKGGGVSCADGIWVYEDRHGQRHRSSEGPFKQAQSAMYALRGRLEAADPRGTDGFAFGFGVVTPDCPLNVDATEWDDATLIDLPRLAGRKDMEQLLSKLYQYWESRRSRSGRLFGQQLSQIRQLLRPDFEKVPPLGAKTADLSGRMLRLTEIQYSVLDFVAAHHRVLITGGAGTGKTLVALEAARREAADGRRVILVVESPVLAAYLEPRVSDGVPVATIDTLPTREAPFDALVMDEAQDLMSLEALEQLDDLVGGSLLTGRWRIFYDSNNQTGIRGRFEQAAYDLLLESASGPPLDLARNCRNTSEIVRQTQLTTGADLGVAMAGAGPPVHFERFTDTHSCAAEVEAHLERLIDHEYVDPSTITILTDEGLGGCLGLLPKRWRKRLVTVGRVVAADWPPTNVSVATVRDFKGLENDFVLLVDIAADSLGRQLSYMYVGMSRARAGLWIAVPEGVWSELARLQKENLTSTVGGA